MSLNFTQDVVLVPTLDPHLIDIGDLLDHDIGDLLDLHRTFLSHLT